MTDFQYNFSSSEKLYTEIQSKMVKSEEAGFTTPHGHINLQLNYKAINLDNYLKISSTEVL